MKNHQDFQRRMLPYICWWKPRSLVFSLFTVCYLWCSLMSVLLSHQVSHELFTEALAIWFDCSSRMYVKFSYAALFLVKPYYWNSQFSRIQSPPPTFQLWDLLWVIFFFLTECQQHCARQLLHLSSEAVFSSRFSLLRKVLNVLNYVLFKCISCRMPAAFLALGMNVTAKLCSLTLTSWMQCF